MVRRKRSERFSIARCRLDDEAVAAGLADLPLDDLARALREARVADLLRRVLFLARPYGRAKLAGVFSLALAQAVFQVIGATSIFPFLAIAADPERIRRRVETGYCDRLETDLGRILENLRRCEAAGRATMESARAGGRKARAAAGGSPA